MATSNRSSKGNSSKFNNSRDPTNLVSLQNSQFNWDTLEEKFNELLNYLKTPSIGFSSSLHRAKHTENVEIGLESIIEVALSEAHMLLAEGNYKEAIRGGLKALQFTQHVYGTNALEQIEPYFLLAKASQHLKNYEDAEEFLSIANWTIIKCEPNVPTHIYAELHQNFGLLYMEKGDIDEAIKNFAKNIYYLSLIHGTESLITSFGYYNLGNVFNVQKKLDRANDFLSKVTDIWYKHLKSAFLKETKEENKDLSLNLLDELDEEKINEANRMFENMIAIQLERFGENHFETGKVYLVYGLFNWWIGEIFKAKECLDKSSSIMQYVLGESHEMTREVKELTEKMV